MEEEEDMDGEDERKQESSPERTSYRCVAAGRHQLMLIRCAVAPRPSQAENYLAGGNWKQLQTNSVGQCSLIACYP